MMLLFSPKRRPLKIHYMVNLGLSSTESGLDGYIVLPFGGKRLFAEMTKEITWAIFWFLILSDEGCHSKIKRT